MPVRGLSVAEVRAAVSSLLDRDVVNLAPVPGSAANQDYLVTSGDGLRVMVKFGPAPELAREAWACQLLTELDLRVPRILALDLANADLSGSAVLMMDVVAGGPSNDVTVAREVGALFRQVHAQELPGWGEVDVTADGGRGHHDSWEAGVLAEVDGLKELVEAGVLELSVTDAVRSHVTPGDHFTYEGVGVLLHNDLKIEHLFALDSGHRPQLTAVIDWGDASAGDPDADLARLSMAGPEVTAGFLDGYGTQLTPGLDERLTRYRILWNVGALVYERRTGGTWFDTYRKRIFADRLQLG